MNYIVFHSNTSPCFTLYISKTQLEEEELYGRQAALPHPLGPDLVSSSQGLDSLYTLPPVKISLFGSDQFWHQQNLPAMSLPLSLFWEKSLVFFPLPSIPNLLPTPPVRSFYFSSLLINLGHAGVSIR